MSKRNDPKGRNRKAAVWGDTPHRLRRMVVKGDCTMADVPSLLRFRNPHVITQYAARAADDGVMAAQDGFHEAIESPLNELDRDTMRDPNNGKPPPDLDAKAKRSEAAKRAAATRKANAERERAAARDGHQT